MAFSSTRRSSREENFPISIGLVGPRAFGVQASGSQTIPHEDQAECGVMIAG